MKKLLRFYLAIITALQPFGGFAQNSNSPTLISPEMKKVSQAEMARNQKDFEAKYPLLAMQKDVRQRHSNFPDATRRMFNFTTPAIKKAPLFANANSTIWVNLYSKEGWTYSQHDPYGYYSFHPTNPITYTSLYETMDQNVARYGIQYTEGHIYGVNLDTQYSAYGIIFEYLYDTNTETGETTMENLDYTRSINLAAVETAQASDGTVYGEFYSPSGQSLEWGTVDYSTKERTTIGPATNIYVALGITNDGQLYGIATNGNLYSINKSNGVETLVGPTGLTLADGAGQYYGQTGEIDQRDNTFYWAAIDVNGQGGFYEVDLTSGNATKIADENDQIFGMLIPIPEAADGAPAKISSASADFGTADLNGTISFTAPTKTYAGADLTGDLTYTIKANDSIVATGNTTAGASVNADVQLKAGGQYQFVITTTNEAGESPKFKINKWIGYDAPTEVSNITLTKENDQTVLVSWNAPSEGTHGGTLDDIVYDIYRISNNDTLKIASDIEDTTYRDSLTETAIKYYNYGIVAKSQGQSNMAISRDGIVAGTAVEPTWTDEFNNENDFKLFSVIDANNDGTTWSYDSYRNAATSFYNSRNGNDDWLMTPPIHMASGRVYNVTFKTRNINERWANSMEVKYGSDATAEAMSNTLLETFTPSVDFKTYSLEIKPDADGRYYVGFHDNTEKASQMCVLVDSFVVEAGAKFTAPDSVTNLSISPAQRGRLNATISFIAPVKNVNGDDIATIDSFVIKRDGKAITTIGATNAGASVSYIDKSVPSHGNHIYEVTPYIAGDFGRKTSSSAFIGQDSPKAPENLSFIDYDNNILAQWTALSDEGANGGYVNPSEVKVSFWNVQRVDGQYSMTDSLTASVPGALSVEIPYNTERTTAPDGKTQTLYYVAYRADGTGGSSGTYVESSIVVGPSINLPYKESLAGGNIDNNFAWMNGNLQYANNSRAADWRIVADNSADGDGGSFLWSPYDVRSGFHNDHYYISDGDELSINTPKISLRGATNPKLYFYINTIENDAANLRVQILTPDGVTHEGANIDLSTIKPGWTLRNVDLNPYKNERYIIVRFLGVAQGDNVSIGIDNINVFDQLLYNLKASGIEVPKRLTAGKSGKVNVYVENYGASTVSNYNVILYADDKPVDTLTIDRELPVLAKDTVTLNLPVAINQENDIRVHAYVDFDNELEPDDNATEDKIVKVKASEYTKVSDLSAKTGDDNAISLSWSKPPVAQPTEVTEDFESYDAFSTDFDEWSLVDGDHGLAGGIFNGLDYPGQGTAFAFDVFNPTAISDVYDILGSNPGLTPHSGKQFAGAPYAENSSENLVDADNWLISPELSGHKQAIRFYAFNTALQGSRGTTVYNEKFDVLYSTTNNDTASFIVLQNDTADGANLSTDAANWKEITVELPEGAKYFAIHHKTEAGSNFLFGIDDVDFAKAAVGASDSIVAYNIYRDGELISSVNSNDLTFEDYDADDGNHIYNVTVVYEDAEGNTNESGFSNNASIEVINGINDIKANTEGLFDIYTIDGKTVKLGAKNLNGLAKGIYIINDKKYIIK